MSNQPPSGPPSGLGPPDQPQQPPPSGWGPPDQPDQPQQPGQGWGQPGPQGQPGLPAQQPGQSWGQPGQQGQPGGQAWGPSPGGQPPYQPGGQPWGPPPGGGSKPNLLPFILAGVAVVVVAIVLAVLLISRSGGGTSPQDTAEDFVSAAESGDCEKALALITDKLKKSEDANCGSDSSFLPPDTQVSFGDVKVTDETDSTATATVEATLAGQKVPLQLKLVKQDGEWLIDEFAGP